MGAPLYFALLPLVLYLCVYGPSWDLICEPKVFDDGLLEAAFFQVNTTGRLGPHFSIECIF